MAYLLPGRENCCWLTANLYSFNCIFFSSFWVVKIKKLYHLILCLDTPSLFSISWFIQVWHLNLSSCFSQPLIVLPLMYLTHVKLVQDVITASTGNFHPFLIFLAHTSFPSSKDSVWRFFTSVLFCNLLNKIDSLINGNWSV